MGHVPDDAGPRLPDARTGSRRRPSTRALRTLCAAPADGGPDSAFALKLRTRCVGRPWISGLRSATRPVLRPSVITWIIGR